MYNQRQTSKRKTTNARIGHQTDTRPDQEGLRARSVCGSVGGWVEVRCTHCSKWPPRPCALWLRCTLRTRHHAPTLPHIRPVQGRGRGGWGGSEHSGHSIKLGNGAACTSERNNWGQYQQCAGTPRTLLSIVLSHSVPYDASGVQRNVTPSEAGSAQLSKPMHLKVGGAQYAHVNYQRAGPHTKTSPSRIRRAPRGGGRSGERQGKNGQTTHFPRAMAVADVDAQPWSCLKSRLLKSACPN